MKIPITRSGELVAEVVFSGGGPLTATGAVSKIGKGTNRDVKIIRDAILKFKTFSTDHVYTPKGHVQIWRGFWGWLCGLRLVLPSIGYRIKNARIDWP